MTLPLKPSRPIWSIKNNKPTPKEEKETKKMAGSQVRIAIQIAYFVTIQTRTYLIGMELLDPTKTRKKEKASPMRMTVLYMGLRTNGISVTKINMVTTSDPGASPRLTTARAPTSQALQRHVIPR